MNNQKKGFISAADFEDKFIPCCDCGDEFLWSAGEQAFYHAMSLLTPRRCKPCRQIRKSRPILIETKDGDTL